MGNNNSSSPSAGEFHAAKPSIDENLTYIKKVNDECYGEVKIFADRSRSEFVAIKSMTYQSREEFRKGSEEAKKRELLELPTVVQTKRIIISDEKDSNPKSYKIQGAFEYLTRNLAGEIAKRRKVNRYMTENELIGLIDCLLSALIFLDSKNIKHQDIRPQTILYSKDGIYKLTDIQYLNNGINAYKRMLMGVADDIYLSPELFCSLKHRNLSPSFNNQKSEVFSLGLVVLEAGILTEVQDIYDLSCFGIRTSVLRGHLDKLNKRFSERTCKLIESMLELDDALRVDYKTMLQYITKYMNEETPSSLLGEEVTNQYEVGQDDYNSERLDDDDSNKEETKPDENNGNYHKRTVSDAMLRNSLLDLEDKIKAALSMSHEIQTRYNSLGTQHTKQALIKNDLEEIKGKREDYFLKNTKKAMISPVKEINEAELKEESILESNRIYDLYLREYEKMRNGKN